MIVCMVSQCGGVVAVFGLQRIRVITRRIPVQQFVDNDQGNRPKVRGMSPMECR